MSYWTQKLKDFLTTGSEFPKQEEANNLHQPPRREGLPIAANDDGPANLAL